MIYDENEKKLTGETDESMIRGTGEYLNAIKPYKKTHRRDQAEHIAKYLYSTGNKVLIMNEEHYHYRVVLDDKTKLDVWASTTKHTIVGSGNFKQGFSSIKKIIEKYDDAANQK